MPTTLTKGDILELIANNQIETALSAIQKGIGFSNDIILLKSRWNGLQKDISNGTISSENATLQENRVKNSLITMAQNLSDAFKAEGIDVPKAPANSSSPAPNGKAKVFISYNHKDKETAHRIRDFFIARDISVTIDSEKMKAGEDIKSFINNCIKNTDVTVSLVSTRSLMSAWVGMESINTLIGENIANKKFIPVAIETDFFERSYVRKAVEQINKTLEEIDDEVKWRLENNVGMEDLQNERTRYGDLKSKLPSIVANLKERLTIDISGENFEPGMERVVLSIVG